jgi:type II secretory pathway pseudopilin PulG
VLFAATLLSLTLAGVGAVWSISVRREREQQLLWVGSQFERALSAYYLRGPGGLRQLPRSLGELLEDHRGPVLLRHLRRIYVDPMTGRADWQLLRAADGGIHGLHSRAPGAPLKQRNFSRDGSFEDASCYCEWVFEVRVPARQ